MAMITCSNLLKKIVYRKYFFMTPKSDRRCLFLQSATLNIISDGVTEDILIIEVDLERLTIRVHVQ